MDLVSSNENKSSYGIMLPMYISWLLNNSLAFAVGNV